MEATLAIIAVVVSVLSGVGAVAGVRVSRANLVTSTAIDLLEPLRVRIDELEAELAEIRAEVEAEKREREMLHKWALGLRAQLIDAGLYPIEYDEIRRLEP